MLTTSALFTTGLFARRAISDVLAEDSLKTLDKVNVIDLNDNDDIERKRERMSVCVRVCM